MKTEHECYRRKANIELTQLYGKPEIGHLVKAARTRWLIHTVRIADASRAKNVLEKGRRHGRRGRPRSKWIQTCEEDLRSIELVINSYI